MPTSVEMDGYFTATQVRERFGRISDMTLWRWLQDPALDFPKPVVIQRVRYFSRPAIIAWEEKLPRDNAGHHLGAGN